MFVSIDLKHMACDCVAWKVRHGAKCVENGSFYFGASLWEVGMAWKEMQETFKLLFRVPSPIECTLKAASPSEDPAK